MRLDVKKFLFFGPATQKNEFFRKAQSAGLIEFIDQSGHKFDIVPEPVKVMNKALKITRRLPLKKQASFETVEEALGIAHEVNSRQEKIDRLNEQLKTIEQEMERVAVFGHFSKGDITFIEQASQRHIQFFFAKNVNKIPDVPELISVGKDHELYYFMAINKEKKSYEGMVEMTIEHSYGDLFKQRRAVKSELQHHEYRLKELAAYRTLIKQAVVHEFNSHYLTVNRNFVEYHWEESFFSVEGWVADNRLEELDRILESFSIYMSPIQKEDHEVLPTHLENTGAARLGEDLVYVYDIPSVSDKDPSAWVLWAFAFFFAFIIGDGGYGLIFLGFYFWMRRDKNPSPSAKRFTKLVGVLSISCILWGAAVTSFFGIEFNLENPLKHYAPLTQLVEAKANYHIKMQDAAYQECVEKIPELKNVTVPYEFLTKGVVTSNGKTVDEVYENFADSVMLEFALFVGVVHLIMSMLRDLKRSNARIGWIFFLIGAYLYFPNVLGATSLIHYAFGIPKAFAGLIGPYILLGGVGLAVVLALIQKKLSGAEEIMNIIQVFADVLSYLRLYALALAGSIMANTFNDFGMKMNIVFGVIVVIAGHAINIGLSIMGGVIHGLRLNFLEWYHYSFEGGGKRHKPLSLFKLYK